MTDDLRKSQFVVQNTNAYRQLAERHLESSDDTIRCFAMSLITMCMAYDYARTVDQMLDEAEALVPG